MRIQSKLARKAVEKRTVDSDVHREHKLSHQQAGIAGGTPLAHAPSLLFLSDVPTLSVLFRAKMSPVNERGGKRERERRWWRERMREREKEKERSEDGWWGGCRKELERGRQE